MGPRERPSAVLEELDVTKPATVDLPLLLEPDRRRKPLLDRRERFDVTLDLEVIDRESGPLEEPPCAGLAVREAGRPARLLPLVGVQRDEGEDLARPERPAGPLGDRVGHAEVGRDQVGLERRVLFDLDVADDEVEEYAASACRRASSISLASRSTPTTARQRGASVSASRPEPVPASSTVSSASGSALRRSRKTGLS